MKFVIELELDKLTCPIETKDHVHGPESCPKEPVRVASLLMQLAKWINDNGVPETETIEDGVNTLGKVYKA